MHPESSAVSAFSSDAIATGGGCKAHMDCWQIQLRDMENPRVLAKSRGLYLYTEALPVVISWVTPKTDP